jgi:hypothetical protein
MMHVLYVDDIWKLPLDAGLCGELESLYQPRFYLLLCESRIPTLLSIGFVDLLEALDVLSVQMGIQVGELYRMWHQYTLS